MCAVPVPKAGATAGGTSRFYFRGRTGGDGCDRPRQKSKNDFLRLLNQEKIAKFIIWNGRKDKSPRLENDYSTWVLFVDKGLNDAFIDRLIKPRIEPVFPKLLRLIALARCERGILAGLSFAAKFF